MPPQRDSSPLIIDVHSIEANRSRRNLFPPVRRFRRNREDIALGQVVNFSAFNRRARHLIRIESLRVDQGPTRDERRFALHDDENVVGMLMVFDFIRALAICQYDELRIFHDLSALDHRGRDRFVVDVMNGCRNTASQRSSGGGQEKDHRQQCAQQYGKFHFIFALSKNIDFRFGTSTVIHQTGQRWRGYH
jgi:hypothetical protein